VALLQKMLDFILNTDYFVTRQAFLYKRKM